jgi:hypothetical protein
MNKVSVLIFLWVTATGASAQTVFFRNDVMFTIEADRNVYFADGTAVVGTQYLAQLYYGASPSSLNPVTSAPARFRDVTASDPLAGKWVGATRTLSGFSVGQTVTLQVRAWDGTVAGTYEQAAALNFLGTQHGTSAPFTYQIPSAAVPPAVFYIENFRGFTLVPEPSMALLAIVGIAGLCFCRRRTKSAHDPRRAVD